MGSLKLPIAKFSRNQLFLSDAETKGQFSIKKPTFELLELQTLKGSVACRQTLKHILQVNKRKHTPPLSPGF